MITVPMTVAAAATEIPVSIAETGAGLAVSIGAAYAAVAGTQYDGPYTVTPSAEEQVLQTEGKVMTDSVTVNPIPNNYGLITWNGSVLTVS